MPLLALCATADVPEGEARRIAAGGFDYAVFNLGGVFFVTTPEFENIGYFRTEEDACLYIDMNWDDVEVWSRS